MTHTCHATGCEVSVPPKMFMCKQHWFSLPKPMRDAIWATYRPGQEETKDPSRDYLHNAREAISYLEAAAATSSTIQNGVQLPAITIWQPWASLIVAGAKPFEFRSWVPPKAYQGKRIAIHTGARAAPRNEVRDLLLRLHSSHWRETGLKRESAIALLDQMLPQLASLPLRAVLCTAVLGEPVRNLALATVLGTNLVNDSDRGEHTNWGWPLTAIRKFDPPIPARGAQGFFPVTVPADAAAD